MLPAQRGGLARPSPGGFDHDGDLSDYEKVRETNISTRVAELKRLGFYGELQEAKRDVLQQESSAKVVAVKKSGKLQDVTNQEALLPSRRSARVKNPVVYNDDYHEVFAASRKRRAKTKDENEENYDPNQDDSQQSPSSSPTKKRRKSSRKKEAVNYSEDVNDQIPATDSYIWCSVCNDQKYDGCELHPPRFASLEEFTLKVEKSSVARNAGEGVVNRGEEIKEGTVFGPYLGKYHTKATYKKKIDAGEESGNAWEIKDQDGLKVIGYIDPGRSVDPKSNWLTKINCATKSHAQNMVGFQLHGQIYYRVTQDIVNGAELLVFYGQEYAKELGINVAKLDFFKGKEDHKEEAWQCPGCDSFFSSESSMFIHQDTSTTCSKLAQHDRTLVCKGCKEVFSNGKTLVDHQNGFCFPNCYKQKASEISNKCAICSKVFPGPSGPNHMKRHMRNIHAKIKDFKCPTCGKAFSEKADLTKHIKAVHQMARPHQCPDCGQSFTEARNMENHREAIHLGIRYPCTYTPPPGDFEEHTFSCNKTFTNKPNLIRHIKNIHLKNFYFECQICLDKDVWWGCMQRSHLDTHKKSKHPVEYKEEEAAYIAKHPYECKLAKCKKRFETEVERLRHQEKLH